MEELVYNVNFHFEQQLYNTRWQQQKQKWLKLNQEWEYLYFFCDDKPLLACHQYSNLYLQMLERLNIPASIHYKTKFPSQDWWGDTKNLEMERLLNDKFVALEIIKNLNLFHLATKVDEFCDLLHAAATTEMPMFIRQRFGQAGKNLKLFYHLKAMQDYMQTAAFTNGPFFQDLKNHVGILCGPWVEREFDFGSRFTAHESDHWLSFVDIHGIYRGGLYLEDHDKFLKLTNILKVDFQKIIKLQREVYKAYCKKVGKIETIQFDSFAAKNEIVPFQEANHRKTMGDILVSLTKKFSKNGLGILLFDKNDQVVQRHILKTWGYCPNKKEGILQLTPNESTYQFCSYFIGFNNLDQIDLLKSFFPKVFQSQKKLEYILTNALNL